MSNQEERDDASYRYLCKYQIKTLIFTIDEEARAQEVDEADIDEDEPKMKKLDWSNIMGFDYFSDYEFRHMAILKLVTRLDIRQRLWILKNKKWITCHFELDKVKMDVDVEEIDYESAQECWNLEFVLYFNDEDDTIDTSILEERLFMNEGEEADVNELQKENYYETQNILELYLFHPKLLKASRQTYNTVWTNNTLQNFVGEMLTRTGHSDILMSKFDNADPYKELLMPSLHAYKTLIYLDQHFGFYEKGGLIFYDIDTLYIINLNGEVTAKREDEWTEVTFMIPQLDRSVPGCGMIHVEDEEIFYPTLSEMELNVQEIATSKNVELGANTRRVNLDNEEMFVSEAHQPVIDGRNEELMVTKEQHKYHLSVSTARKEENGCIIYISGQNWDINAFRPNKTYRVNYEDQTKQDRFGKREYRLAYAYHSVKATSTEYMDSSHRIILKLTYDPDKPPSDDDG